MWKSFQILKETRELSCMGQRVTWEMLQECGSKVQSESMESTLIEFELEYTKSPHRHTIGPSN